MAKRGEKKVASGRFWKGMLIYAVIFLVITAVGLGFFWKFMEAYELSRPKTAVEAYVSGLNPRELFQRDTATIAQVNSALLSEDDCVELVAQTLTEPVSYAKKSRESSSQRQVYAIYSGEQELGEVHFVPMGKASFGFTPWVVEQENYDFSWILAQPVTLTVPESWKVSVNGVALDESYISARDIPYPALEVFHGDFPMDTMVTYTVEGLAGDVIPELSDETGQPVTLPENGDFDVLLSGCTEAQKQELNGLVNEFLIRYAAFTGSSNRAPEYSYWHLVELMVPKGALAERLKTALDGLHYAQSYGDKVLEYTVNHHYSVGQERFMVDVTYLLETYGKKGPVQTTNNLKLVYIMTDAGLKVETMTLY